MSQRLRDDREGDSKEHANGRDEPEDVRGRQISQEPSDNNGGPNQFYQHEAATQFNEQSRLLAQLQQLQGLPNVLASTSDPPLNLVQNISASPSTGINSFYSGSAATLNSQQELLNQLSLASQVQQLLGNSISQTSSSLPFPLSLLQTSGGTTTSSGPSAMSPQIPVSLLPALINAGYSIQQLQPFLGLSNATSTTSNSQLRDILSHYPSVRWNSQQQSLANLLATAGISSSSSPMPSSSSFGRGVRHSIAQQDTRESSSIFDVSSTVSAAAQRLLLAQQSQILSLQSVLDSAEATTRQQQGPTITSVGKGRAIPLYMDQDEDTLTEYQCMLRKQIELFEAGPEDTRCSAQGRNTPILIGQVGLRCRHCASLPRAARTKGAVYYSQTIDGVYQIAQNMSKVHLGTRCNKIPRDVQDKLNALRNDSQRASGGKQYWADGMRSLGVYEDGRILRIQKAGDAPPARLPLRQG